VAGVDGGGGPADEANEVLRIGVVAVVLHDLSAAADSGVGDGHGGPSGSLIVGEW
jgi:hypothetical protein